MFWSKALLCFFCTFLLASVKVSGHTEKTRACWCSRGGGKGGCCGGFGWVDLLSCVTTTSVSAVILDVEDVFVRTLRHDGRLL